MEEILSSIVQCVLVIVAGLITRYVIPWLKTKLAAEKLNAIEQWVKLAVTAAEQVYCKDCQGSEKKSYVTYELKKYLATKGLDITDEQLDILIEAAVKEMNLAMKKKNSMASKKELNTNKGLSPEDMDDTSTEDEDTDV